MAEITFAIDNVVLLGAAVLVLFMQAGFAMLEVGLNSAKNTDNILFKNIMDLALGVLLFFVIGYGLMYPGDAYEGKYFGFRRNLAISSGGADGADRRDAGSSGRLPVPSGVCCHGGDDRVGCRGRPHEVRRVSGATVPC